MEPVRIAYIGCGAHASRNLVPCVFYAPVELVGLCDLVEERARAVATKIGCREIYTDYGRLLEVERLEGVIVAVPPQAVLAILRDALAAAKHVLLEKPPGATLEEAKEMARLAAGSDRVVQVGLNRRFAPGYRRARAIIREGGIGEVTHYLGKYSVGHHPDITGAWPWLRDQAIHQLDLLRYLAGEVEEVTALLNDRDGRITSDALVRFANGAVGILTCSEQYGWNKPNEYIEVSGQGRWLSVEDTIHVTQHPATSFEMEPILGDEPSLRWEPSMALPRSRSLSLQGYANELAAFAEAIRGNRFDGAPYIADAWKSLRLAWALHQSNGKTVRPEDF